MSNWSTVVLVVLVALSASASARYVQGSSENGGTDGTNFLTFKPGFSQLSGITLSAACPAQLVTFDGSMVAAYSLSSYRLWNFYVTGVTSIACTADYVAFATKTSVTILDADTGVQKNLQTVNNAYALSFSPYSTQLCFLGVLPSSSSSTVDLICDVIGTTVTTTNTPFFYYKLDAAINFNSYGPVVRSQNQAIGVLTPGFYFNSNITSPTSGVVPMLDDGVYFYAATSEKLIVVQHDQIRNGASMLVKWSIPFYADLKGIVLDSRSGIVVAYGRTGLYSSPRLYFFDKSSGAAVSSTSLTCVPASLAADTQNGYTFMACTGGAVYIFNTASGNGVYNSNSYTFNGKGLVAFPKGYIQYSSSSTGIYEISKTSNTPAPTNPPPNYYYADHSSTVSAGLIIGLALGAAFIIITTAVVVRCVRKHRQSLPFAVQLRDAVPMGIVTSSL